MNRTDNPVLQRKMLDHLASMYKIKEIREPNHLSSYVYCRTKGFLDQKQAIEPTDEEVLLFSIGYGLQDVLTPIGLEPQVINREGIIYRPDFPIIFTGNLGELKTTRKSAKKHFMDEAIPETWLMYMKGGCHLTDTNRYDLFVLYLMGNYSPPFPQLYADTFEFEKEEIDDNWKVIVDNKAVMDDALASGVMPSPFRNCLEWECQYCRYKLICETMARLAPASIR